MLSRPPASTIPFKRTRPAARRPLRERDARPCSRPPERRFTITADRADRGSPNRCQAKRLVTRVRPATIVDADGPDPLHPPRRALHLGVAGSDARRRELAKTTLASIAEMKRRYRDPSPTRRRGLKEMTWTRPWHCNGTIQREGSTPHATYSTLAAGGTASPVSSGYIATRPLVCLWRRRR